MIRPTSARTADALYFPPGFRIGVRLPAGLTPSHRPDILSAGGLRVMMYEPLALDGSDTYDTWHGDDRETLLSERTISASVKCRLFEWKRFADDPEHSSFKLVVTTLDADERPTWFGRLDITTQPTSRGPRERARSQPMIDEIVAGVGVRPALSVDDMLREHGMRMDLSGLYPHHFGDKLTISLSPPNTPQETWVNDCYISMPTPPLDASFPWDGVGETEEAKTFADGVREANRPFEKAFGPMTEWISNGILWHAQAEKPLSGTKTHTRATEGYGAKGFIRLYAFCERPDRAEIGAALERVARSVEFLR